ncbi:hypothetical protein WOLCODRAFT_73896 [Wolfiporia cocos MD-104 SS10]|uniref:G-protein coupled receptors family 1 profile domain-containing protein n=1 Tax=Wolfiporia cocos (strain MD-104) TaxID=742152 RepID=A0A2H3JZC6_WOLCO|nr:hypothetical protein WOLCODRAFT_73896 [Wolfiporia cocos MD-104 SS10]
MKSSQFQNSLYIGNNLNGILYGAKLVLYIISMRSLLTSRQRSSSDNFYILFSTALLLLITVFVVTQAIFGGEMWIANAGYPGGPSAYLNRYASVWYETLGTAASVVLNLLADALMIYRCHVVYNNRMLLLMLSVIYIGSIATGVFLICTSGLPSGNFFDGLAAKSGTAYYVTTIALNIISTALICGRIHMYAKRISADKDTIVLHCRSHNVVIIIIESALPYTLCGVAFLVSHGVKNGVEILFLSTYTMFTCISPQLIIMRIVTGRAWIAHRKEITRPMTNPTRQSQREYDMEEQAQNLGMTGTDSTVVNVELHTISRTDFSLSDDVKL